MIFAFFIDLSFACVMPILYFLLEVLKLFKQQFQFRLYWRKI